MGQRAEAESGRDRVTAEEIDGQTGLGVESGRDRQTAEEIDGQPDGVTSRERKR